MKNTVLKCHWAIEINFYWKLVSHIQWVGRCENFLISSKSVFEQLLANLFYSHLNYPRLNFGNHIFWYNYFESLIIKWGFLFMWFAQQSILIMVTLMLDDYFKINRRFALTKDWTPVHSQLSYDNKFTYQRANKANEWIYLKFSAWVKSFNFYLDHIVISKQDISTGQITMNNWFTCYVLHS